MSIKRGALGLGFVCVNLDGFATLFLIQARFKLCVCCVCMCVSDEVTDTHKCYFIAKKFKK